MHGSPPVKLRMRHSVVRLRSIQALIARCFLVRFSRVRLFCSMISALVSPAILVPAVFSAAMLSPLLITPAGVLADQSDPALPDLYLQLQSAPDGSTAAVLEAQIWQIWLDAPDGPSLALVQQISMSMDQGDLDISLALCNRLVDLYPDYAEAWNKRATVHYLMSSYDDSVADILETLKREPRHFGAISGLGLIFHRSGKLEEALGAFEQVLEISPQSANAKRSVEQLRQELGKGI